MNIHELKPRKNDALVEQLAKMLKQAETGELQSVCWIAVKSGGMTENGSMCNDGTDLLAMIGESYLLMRQLARVAEGGEFVPE